MSVVTSTRIIGYHDIPSLLTALATAVSTLDANRDQAQQIASLYARVFRADGWEPVAGAAAVQSALAHPVMVRARVGPRRPG